MNIIRQDNIVEEYRQLFKFFKKPFLQINSLVFYVQFSITAVPESTKLIVLKEISIISIWKIIKM